jgi:hypothetical protein
VAVTLTVPVGETFAVAMGDTTAVTTGLATAVGDATVVTLTSWYWGTAPFDPWTPVTTIIMPAMISASDNIR